jgi:hypothetical protein
MCKRQGVTNRFMTEPPSRNGTLPITKTRAGLSTISPSKTLGCPPCEFISRSMAGAVIFLEDVI